MILHSCAALFGLLHWILVWRSSPFKDVELDEASKALYTWVLFLTVILFIAAVVVNLVVDRPKNTGKLTSIVAIVAGVFALYYIIAWWVGKDAEGARKLEDIGPLELRFGFKLGRFLYWLYALCALAGAAFPAAFGGLA